MAVDGSLKLRSTILESEICLRTWIPWKAPGSDHNITPKEPYVHLEDGRNMRNIDGSSYVAQVNQDPSE